jgi:tetratricopeptide (TPR) repeat protein
MFHAAIKCYTRCLGLKTGNYVAFSNRAMAQLKLKRFAEAEADCGAALRIEPTHIKSLQRRASARIALGKARAAVQDLERASGIQDPPSKQVRICMYVYIYIYI